MKKTQVENFKASARAAECDEDESRFEDRLRRVVKITSKPVKKKAPK